MQQQKGSMIKKLLSAEEVARELNVKKFLVRFWEKEFKLKLEHAGAGNRCYSHDDLKVFAEIKDLVHNKKMSISQARKHLEANFGVQTHQADSATAVSVAPNAEGSVPGYKKTDVIVPAPAVADEVTSDHIQSVDVASIVNEQVTEESFVQPAVASVEVDVEGQEELFMQNIRTFKEQLLNLKQLLDLE